MIPKKQYAQIIEVLPILCVDIIIRNPHDEFLLIKRANEALKGQWWVVGGRVFKGETLEQAAIRKVKEETALKVEFVQPVGYYEDVCESNPFGLEIPMHSVSVVFSTIINGKQQIRLDYQSTEWRYSKELPEQFRVKLFVGHQSKYIYDSLYTIGK